MLGSIHSGTIIKYSVRINVLQSSDRKENEDERESSTGAGLAASYSNKERPYSATLNYDYILMLFPPLFIFQICMQAMLRGADRFLLCLSHPLHIFMLLCYFYSDTISVVLVFSLFFQRYRRIIAITVVVQRERLPGLIAFSITCTHAHTHLLWL